MYIFVKVYFKCGCTLNTILPMVVDRCYTKYVCLDVLSALLAEVSVHQRPTIIVFVDNIVVRWAEVVCILSEQGKVVSSSSIEWDSPAQKYFVLGNSLISVASERHVFTFRFSTICH